jgi:Fic family protein
MFAGTFHHLNADDKDHLVIETLSTEALTTSEIEGEILDRASVQSSVRRHLGLGADNRRVRPAEQGVAEMSVDLYKSFDEPLLAPETGCLRRSVVMAAKRGSSLQAALR